MGLYETTSGGVAEILSWASGALLSQPIISYNYSCTTFYIVVFNKDELSLKNAPCIYKFETHCKAN